MDDTEYYAMMRRQYSHTAGLTGKSLTREKKSHPAASETAGTFSEWKIKHGHEDAEMFEERNRISGSSDSLTS